MGSFRLYWDTNVFIRLVENDDEVAYRLGALQLCAFEEDSVSVHTSELTFAELMVRPLRENDVDLIELYRGLLRSNAALRIASVDRQCLEAAAGIKAHGGIALPDAIHVATAQMLNCTHFVTGDRRLGSRTGMPWVDLTVPALVKLLEAIDD